MGDGIIHDGFYHVTPRHTNGGDIGCSFINDDNGSRRERQRPYILWNTRLMVKLWHQKKTVDYKWMMQNLPVCGDGTTHYYHQGPVFEGDAWDPSETVNLKDKGAVKGTNIKDLCDLVGGMTEGGEVVIHAEDGYEITLAYSNIYQPLDIQGPVVYAGIKETMLRPQILVTLQTMLIVRLFR